MKAIVVAEKGGRAEIVDKAVPELPSNYVKVKVKAVALNPTDWKHVDYIATGGETVGCDYAGTVVEIGSAVKTDVKVGDDIFGIVHGSKVGVKDTGAFAEYIIAKDGLFGKIPSNISVEAAATWPVAIITNGLAVWQKLKLPTPAHPAKESFPIFIYGGSTAMGMVGIQIAKLAGLHVITTASKRNFDLLKNEYGADEVYDYNDPDIAKEIRKSTNNKLYYVYDCIGEKGSIAICAGALAEKDDGKGLHYATLIGSKGFPRNDVDIQHVLGYTVMGDSFRFGEKQFDAVTEDYDFTVEHWPVWTKLIADGKLKPSRFEVKDGGFDGILEGMNLVKEGKNSAMKLVYRISE